MPILTIPVEKITSRVFGTETEGHGCGAVCGQPAQEDTERVIRRSAARGRRRRRACGDGGLREQAESETGHGCTQLEPRAGQAQAQVGRTAGEFKYPINSKYVTNLTSNHSPIFIMNILKATVIIYTYSPKLFQRN